MSTAAEESPSLLTRLRRHWPLVALVTGGLVLIALLVSLLRPPVYLAEARLAVGSGQMTNLNIPGYPTAAQDMASDYARWLTDQGVKGQGVPEGTLSIAASPIVESSVIRIEATANDPDVAVDAAAQSAELLTDAVNQVRDENNPDLLMTEIQANIGPLLEAQRQARSAQDTYVNASDEDQPEIEVERRFQAYIDATSELTTLELEQDARRDRYRALVSTRSTEADLGVVQDAQIISNDRGPVVQRNVFLGLLAGLLLSTALALALEFRRERAPGGLANKHLTSTDDGLVRRLVARRRRTEGRASAGS